MKARFDNSLIQKAALGDPSSLKELIHSIQDKIFGLCLRMLWSQEDAEEACQEILIKTITHLSEFKGQSQFSTWVYRVACNHLLDLKRSNLEKLKLNFVVFEEDLLSAQIDPEKEERESPEFALQVSEVRIGCTTALLNCLDREHRISYIIGEILEMDHNEASEVLGISPSVFRKRLARARAEITRFTEKVCGVIGKDNPCQCARRVKPALQTRRIRKDEFVFASKTAAENVIIEIGKLELSRRTAAHYRAHNPTAKKDFYKFIRKLVSS